LQIWFTSTRNIKCKGKNLDKKTFEYIADKRLKPKQQFAQRKYTVSLPGRLWLSYTSSQQSSYKISGHDMTSVCVIREAFEKQCDSKIQSQLKELEII